ncbi:MAG TPA: hypothetical protein VF637_05130 [Sphingomicrobium sp.]|jgi:hypothetical protein
MNRTAKFLTASILAVMASTAGHAKAEPRVQAMVACRGIAADAARLQCYDQAVGAVGEAMQSGEISSEPDRRAPAMSGVIKASGAQGENFWIELENGDRWLLMPTSFRRRPPQPGTLMTVRKTPVISTYWISGKGWSETKARFLRNGM